MKFKNQIVDILITIIISIFLFQSILKYYKEYKTIKTQIEGINFYLEIIHLSNNKEQGEDIKSYINTFQKYSSRLGLEEDVYKNFDNNWKEFLSFVRNSTKLFSSQNFEVDLIMNLIHYLMVLYFNIKEWDQLKEIVKVLIQENRNLIQDKILLNKLDNIKNSFDSIKKDILDESLSLTLKQNIKREILELCILLKENYLKHTVPMIHIVYFFQIALYVMVLVLYRWYHRKNQKEIIKIKNKAIDEAKELNNLIHTLEQNIHQIIKWNFKIINSLDSYQYKQKELNQVHFAFYKQIIYLNLIFMKLRYIIKYNVNTLMDVQDILKLSRDSFQDYTSSFEEMSSAFQQILVSIQNSVNASVQTRHSLQEKNDQLSQDIKEISRLVDEFNNTKRILQTLFSQMQVFKEKSTEIFKILSTIQDITDRTNLLALNASIEAARAGEYGKGFSVVAEEITKLAEKIKQSTKSVQNILSDYQENIRLLSEKGNNVSKQMDSFFDIFLQRQNSIQKISLFYEEFHNFFNTIGNEHKEVINAISELEKVNQKNFDQFNELSKRFERLENIMIVTDILADDMINLWHKFQLIEHLDFSGVFTVKIPLMDEHHSKLFAIFNELLNVYKEVKNWENKTNEIVKELIDYTIYHFSTEEEIMKKYNYPKFEEHKKAHDKFINYIKKQTFPDLNSVFDFTVFLFDWLVSHIYIIDKQYSEHFESQGLLEQIEEEERKLLAKK